MKQLVGIVLSLVLITACSNSDENDCLYNRLSIAPQGIFIDLRDNNDESMIGNVFARDSFKLYNPNHTLYVYPYQQGEYTSIFVSFNVIESESEYFLEFNQQDNDTLKISYSLREGACFDVLALDQFLYNQQLLYDGEEIEPGYYTILKEE